MNTQSVRGIYIRRKEVDVWLICEVLVTDGLDGHCTLLAFPQISSAKKSTMIDLFNSYWLIFQGLPFKPTIGRFCTSTTGLGKF